MKIRILNGLVGTGLLLGLLASGAWGLAPYPEKSQRSMDRDDSEQIHPITANRLLQEIQRSNARVVLVNVWATWCAPCVEEFPDLVRIQKDFQHRGLQLLFVSADFDSNLAQVKTFLTQQGVHAPTYLKAGPDDLFIETLSPEWSGAIPATFVYDSEGRLRHFREGKGDYEIFARMVRQVLEESEEQTGP